MNQVLNFIWDLRLFKGKTMIIRPKQWFLVIRNIGAHKKFFWTQPQRITRETCPLNPAEELIFIKTFYLFRVGVSTISIVTASHAPRKSFKNSRSDFQPSNVISVTDQSKIPARKIHLNIPCRVMTAAKSRWTQKEILQSWFREEKWPFNMIELKCSSFSMK